MMIKRRPKFLAALVLSFVLMFVSATPVLAESEDEGIDAIAITVIVPPVSERPVAPTQNNPRVFPINVAEGYNYEGVRELVRIYELLPHESPEWINTDSFQRNGYYYQIAEITRRVDVAHTVREHTEIVEIPSATNNLSAVIAGLDATMDFVDEDGYAGVLHLDIRSIAMTQDGTRSSSRTVSQTREFPHLSSPDLALVPQTVNANGRTYNLSNVDWRTNTANPVDFSSVAQTYTAFATYTSTATSTVATGYTTVAEYSGVLTRVASGDVRFVATFIGTPIVSPVVNRPVTAPEQDAVLDETNGSYEENTAYETVTEASAPTNSNYSYETEPIITEAEIPQEATQEPNDNMQNSDFSPLFALLIIIPLVIIAGLVALLLMLKRKLDALVQKSTSAALHSRMARIVERDRREIAGYAEDDDINGIEEETDYNEDGDD